MITGLTKSGEMPGGHKEAGGSLARDPRRDYPDLQTYEDVFIEQAGGEKVWEGRLNQKPESDGDRMVIEPKMVGHQAALEDRKGITGPGFIDKRLTQWGDPSAARRLAVNGLEKINQNGQVSMAPAGGVQADPTPAAIVHAWGQMNSSAAVPDACESWYPSPGIEIGEILLDFANIKGGSGGAWENIIWALADDAVASPENLHNFNATDAAQQAFAIAAGKFYLLLQSYYPGTVEAAGDWEDQWQNVTVLGRQGLALQGDWPEVGFLAKQMLEYAIPLLSYLKVSSESMEDDGYVVQQAWFESGDLATIVKELTKYGLLDWFVMKDKLFELRFPGTYGRKWQAYAGPSELKGTGQDGSRLWAEIVVRYQDVDGTTRTIGPPGSGANFEFESLRITDPDHPAVKAQIPREDLLDLGAISEPEKALQAGERWLEDANELDRSGQATLSGYVQDDKGIWRPASSVQPGDQIRFPDAADSSYRKITVPAYDHDPRTCQVTLDAPAESVQALLERFGATLTPLALA